MVNSEETNRNNIFLMDNTANPAPLGLCAFGTTTILLSLCNAGIIGITSPVFAMAIFYGGIAQIIAGLMEWKKNNNFGFLTFVSFGFFWITFAGVLMLPALGLAKAPQPVDLAAFLAVWGIVALGLLICTAEDAPQPPGNRPCSCPSDGHSSRCSGADGKRPHKNGGRNNGDYCRGSCDSISGLARL